MEAYRYGGICIRTREDWNDQTAEMLTSEGLSRDEADGSRARWCYYQGKAGNEKACILIVASPSNLNYPEPLRVWDKTVNKPAGDVMWNFSPTKQKAFTLEPGKELSLSYRIYVLDKNINATTAEVLSDFESDWISTKTNWQFAGQGKQEKEKGLVLLYHQRQGSFM